MDRRLREAMIHLRITSYRGISIGASHYYGELQFPCYDRGSITLEHPMSARDASRRNKESGYDFPIHKAGELTKGFQSEQAVINWALAHWQEYGDEPFLVDGSTGYSEPKPVLATTLGELEPLQTAAAAIVQKCEDINWFDDPKNDVLMDQYIDEWEQLLLDHLLSHS